MPTRGTIQYHPSLLPLHRGPSSINWPIIQGDTRTGLTIFWPDQGLDTGPILLQKEVEIRDTDTLGSLYFDRLFPLGVAALLEGVDLVRAGKAPKIVQDESKATYEGWCKKEHVQVDWQKPLQTTWNLIRGADPQPGAWTTFGGATVQLLDAKKLEGGAAGQPGQVLAVDDTGMTVAAPGGRRQAGPAMFSSARRSEMMIEPPEMRTTPVRCQLRRHLFTLSRELPTMFASSR